MVDNDNNKVQQLHHHYTTTFANGYEIPLIGLGTFKSDKTIVKSTIKEAIKIGYRYFDCAAFYDNEIEIGLGIDECINEGLVKREELFISSKLWSSYHGKDDVIPALKDTLKNLKCSYLDLYLIHWPQSIHRSAKLDFDFVSKPELLLSPDECPTIETWKQLEVAVDLGLVRNIGLSNFTKKKIQCLLDCKPRIIPAVNQVERHPYLQQLPLEQYCKDHNILLIAYSPLGSPNFFTKVTNSSSLLDDSTIIKLSKKYNCTPAQILIKWSIQNNIPTIPKSISTERLIENYNTFPVDQLDNDDLLLIKKLDKHYRYVRGKFWIIPSGDGIYKNVEYDIWDGE